MLGHEIIYSKETLQANKTVIIPQLYEWLETFRDEVDDEGEPTDEPWNTIQALIERFENDACTDEDFIEIDFHISQINNGEEILTF